MYRWTSNSVIIHPVLTYIHVVIVIFPLKICSQSYVNIFGQTVPSTIILTLSSIF